MIPSFLAETPDLWVINKPCGLNTHSPSPFQGGVIELLEQATGRKGYLCHRLDKETSGVLIIPLRKSVAQELTERFSEREVKKNYLFMTDRSVDFSVFDCASELATKKGRTYSRSSGMPNASTRFEHLEKKGKYSLWKAKPRTGKTHQIRVHAQEIGIPIVGDSLYGGTPAHRLFLHAAQISFSLGGQVHEYESPLPSCFAALLEHPAGEPSLLQQLRSAREQRQMIFAYAPNECVRLVHAESPTVRCDKFGEVVWYYWYRETLPTEREVAELTTFADEAGGSSWHITIMHNRGQKLEPGSLTSLSSEQVPKEWYGEEGAIRYVLRSDQGRSPGLFLDQRDNRALVRACAEKKRVLNLFSYTGGFSLAAALGGAAEVTSVDTSKKTLEWSKDSFRLNGLDPERYSFIREDARTFLQRARRMKQQYDIIIVDPPSFARSKKKVFSFSKDARTLLKDCFALLAEDGELFVSTNYEKMRSHEFLELIEEYTAPLGLKAIPLSPPFDFALHMVEPLTKCLRATKKTS